MIKFILKHILKSLTTTLQLNTLFTLLPKSFDTHPFSLPLDHNIYSWWGDRFFENIAPKLFVTITFPKFPYAFIDHPNRRVESFFKSTHQISKPSSRFNKRIIHERWKE